MAKRRGVTSRERAEPMYGWALDERGRPIPIGAAKSGARGYLCPICNSGMIAKKGDVNQHHFAHEELTHCSPETVAIAIGGKWLILELGRAMVLKQPVLVKWVISEKTYSADLLEGVTAIADNLPTEHGKADIALVKDDGDIRAVINFEHPTDELALERFVAAGIPIVLPPLDAFRSGQMGLNTLLEASEVRGGWQLQQSVLTEETDAELITDASQIREILRNTVQQSPFNFWAPIELQPGQKHVLRVNDHLLWLPKEVWRAAIGGTLNRLAGLDIIIQEWEPEPDGSVIVLFYVLLHDTRAIAVRRFPDKDSVHASVNSAYRLKKTTASQVARLLATGSA